MAHSISLIQAWERWIQKLVQNSSLLFEDDIFSFSLFVYFHPFFLIQENTTFYVVQLGGSQTLHSLDIPIDSLRSPPIHFADAPNFSKRVPNLTVQSTLLSLNFEPIQITHPVLLACQDPNRVLLYAINYP